ncbi:teneurin-3-like [Mytilus edulis]|uniref:teneurin-3-like n=1 Tax=Mytilus edulis TaxID=6550 RepID=UPI0039EFAF38
MKVAIVLLCFVVAVYSETCFRTSDCTTTKCSDTSHRVICALGHCTCSTGTTGHTCSSGGECRDEHCRFGQRSHCVDGHCHCTLQDLIGGIGR